VLEPGSRRGEVIPGFEHGDVFHECVAAWEARIPELAA
jgi:hypothetical protein